MDTIDWNVPLQRVGKGSYGTAFKAALKGGMGHVILKRIRGAFTNVQRAKMSLREVRSLYHVRSVPTVGKILDYFICMEKEHGGFQAIRRLSEIPLLADGRVPDFGCLDVFLVLEDGGVTAWESLNGPLWSLRRIRVKAGMLGHALVSCHKKGIIHRDVKPNNVVLDKQGFVRLIDFGMARSFQVKKAEAPTGGIQNERYRAPEVFEGGKCEGQPLDSWAFGCVLAEMCLGESPMPEGGVQAVREWVRRKENKKEEIKNMLTRKRADLMASSEGVEALEEIAFLPEGLLQEKPEDRLSLEACIQHKFFRVRDLQKLNLTFPDETPESELEEIFGFEALEDALLDSADLRVLVKGKGKERKGVHRAAQKSRPRNSL